jgi:hypothetical protein
VRVACAWSARGTSFGFLADATPRLTGEKMSVHGGLVILADDGPKRTVRVQLAQQGHLVVSKTGLHPPDWYAERRIDLRLAVDDVPALSAEGGHFAASMRLSSNSLALPSWASRMAAPSRPLPHRRVAIPGATRAPRSGSG